MGTVLSTLGGYSDDEYGESTIGVEAEQKAISPQQETVLPPAVVHCFLHPGELPVKEWRCKLKLKGRKKPAKGILHAFPSSLCFHPRSHSTPVTQFDLVGVSDISLGTKKSKPAVVLHTSIGRNYVGGLSHEELQDCHLVLSSLWTNIRARQPVPQPRPIVAVARAQPLQPQGSSEELKRLAAIGAREQEFGMRAHPALPDPMAALFLHAKQSSDSLRAHGLTPNAPDRLNKTDTILPVSLGSFWKAFASQRWQDWPNIFLPAGRWRIKVGEWEADGVGFSRRVWYSAKPPKSRPSGEPLSFENMASVQRACLVVNRKSLETRIHVAVVSTVNGNEYPKAKEWFELVDISRDKGFPILQVLDYRWREEAPSPLA